MIFVIKLVFFYGKSFKETIKNNKSEFLKSIISIFLFGTIFYLSFEIINVYYNHKYFNKIFTWDDKIIDNKKYFKINFSHLNRVLFL